MVFDHGMGVVSLRSWKHPGYWLKVVNGILVGKVLTRVYYLCTHICTHICCVCICVYCTLHMCVYCTVKKMYYLTICAKVSRNEVRVTLYRHANHPLSLPLPSGCA